ncbi:WD40 repeat protein [Roseivirga pacifica]|uniref:WD40-like Beta Propeller Repeat n=2 Tax=Roseivirga pacifica TaxID=1267423 RepID=A0A1I0R9B4_9BACT|nr:WD40 repeat protein [Roseivirga pacifica]SEW37392.1 WD40-like Beta Propeller Repeat [Roseivirga pacifica]
MKKFMRKSIYILMLLLVAIWVKGQEEKYTIVNLDINTASSDFGATKLGDSLVVFASAQGKQKRRKLKRSINQTPFLDLYVGVLSGQQVVNDEMFSDKLSTTFNEASVTFANDFKTIYFTRNNESNSHKAKADAEGYSNLKIYKASKDEDGKWGNVMSMPFNSDDYSSGLPALSPDGKKLFFVSDMPGSIGGTDIYYVEILDEDQYSQPINVGFNVNTAMKEMFPFVGKDNTLYYSSDRPGGYGGLDIYVAKLEETGFYGVPKKLDYPFNSGNDDFAYFYDDEAKMGFFSSNRDGGKGSDDIYAFFKEECKQTLVGYVRNEESLEVIPDAMVYLYTADSVLLDSMNVGTEARYDFKVDCNAEFFLTSEKELYVGGYQPVTTTEVYNETVSYDLFMCPLAIEKEGKIVLMIGPIYFDFNKYNIRESLDGKEEMDRIVEIMREYPEMVVEVSSYTDSRGTDEYNIELSQERAQSTVDYIVKQGIDPNRIYGKGYGESNPVNGCVNDVWCSEADHQKNRRTEFVIVSMEGEAFEQKFRTDESYNEEAPEEKGGN